MPSPTSPDQANETTPAAPTRTVITEPDFSGEPQPIAALAVRADFPQCALGVHVDIRGFAGVVVEIINQSIVVRSSEGVTQRFNAGRLQTLCAPPAPIEAVPTTRNIDRPKPVFADEPARPKPEAPPRVFIAEPDFSAPARPINDYAGRPDFPKCAYGQHVDVAGYVGVVVEIVKGSLKIQSAAGTTRSYNGEALRKIYGRG
ncbi:MAG: hypothetical protein HY301_01730 [Verrucomicrobia bacterium]|nr:hypothetical protein [Planctomycetota bacterium]MBI3878770.1 hypothetical protein [Verrucomicrobiota bacterium]